MGPPEDVDFVDLVLRQADGDDWTASARLAFDAIVYALDPEGQQRLADRASRVAPPGILGQAAAVDAGGPDPAAVAEWAEAVRAGWLVNNLTYTLGLQALRGQWAQIGPDQFALALSSAIASTVQQVRLALQVDLPDATG